MALSQLTIPQILNFPFKNQLNPINTHSNYQIHLNPTKHLHVGSLVINHGVKEEVGQLSSDSETTLYDNSTADSSSKLVFVAGASGGVGQIIVASVLTRNIKVRLLVRDPEKATKLFGEQDEEKLQIRQGDTRNQQDLDPSMLEGVTHVICCTGTTAFPSRRWDGDNTPERVDWDGVRNLVSLLPSTL